MPDEEPGHDPADIEPSELGIDPTDLDEVPEGTALPADEPVPVPPGVLRAIEGGVMTIEIHPVPVKVGSTIHLCAQAINSVTGVRGPMLTAEGCNFDATQAEEVVLSYTGAEQCRRCNLPVQGDPS